jgi:DNA helicase HerA-like ATPase
MKEGRKFGVVVVSASQGVSDFHPDVLGNAGTKIIFRTNYPSSRKVGGFLKPRRDESIADQIEQLPVGNALVQTPEMNHALQIRMYPPSVVAKALAARAGEGGSVGISCSESPAGGH